MLSSGMGPRTGEGLEITALARAKREKAAFKIPKKVNYKQDKYNMYFARERVP
jgi:hypothetical protein